MHPVHAVGRLVVQHEFERPRVTVPARQGLTHLLVMALSHVDERWRARPAVQILVAAANRHIGIGAIQIDFHRSCAVCQVPHHQGPHLMRLGGNFRHRVNRTGTIIHMRQHGQADTVVECGQHRFRIGLDVTDLQTE